MMQAIRASQGSSGTPIIAKPCSTHVCCIIRGFRRTRCSFFTFLQRCRCCCCFIAEQKTHNLVFMHCILQNCCRQLPWLYRTQMTVLEGNIYPSKGCMHAIIAPDQHVYFHTLSLVSHSGKRVHAHTHTGGGSICFERCTKPPML